MSYSTTYLVVNEIGYSIIDDNSHQGITFEGKANKLDLPNNLIEEIIKIYPDYELNGWDYNHSRDEPKLGMIKIIPYKYMYRDIINIIDNIV